MKLKYKSAILILLFFGITLFLTLNKHSKSGSFNYHSEIWSDKAGYYVYLPSAFNYKFNPENFPDSIDLKTGNGFAFDHKNGKIITKYTCGVALMQLPFYCLAEVASTPMGFERNGFSQIYHWSINIASVFYLVLGLVYLKKFLTTYFSYKSSLFTVLSIFLGTNLYYYSIDETGMSHVYSFFLFCIFLFYLQKTDFLNKINFWILARFGMIIGLIILIRPTNILFLSSFFFLNIQSKSEILVRFRRVIQFKSIAIIALSILIVFLPQFLYWHYLSGSLFNYSYGNEGFNWLNPKFLSVWISPNNGLFLYTPFYLLIMASLILMIKNKKLNGIYILILFFVISYTFSSWWSWSFGCAFGSRSFIEYLSLFSIPLAYGFQEISKMIFIKKAFAGILILILIVFNLKMTYSYDGCFYGENNWDWNAYLNLILSATK